MAGLVLQIALLRLKPPEVDDFLPFYRAGGLVGDPDLFAQTGFHASGLMFLRTPFYAVLMKVFGALSYPVAREVWQGLMAAALVLALWLWPGRRARIAVAACWSAPVLFAFAQGQDVMLMLLAVALTARLWAGGREFGAGLAASLLALKLTFLAPVALVFLARSRRGSYGLAAGVAFQVAVSLAVQGPGWFPEYLAAVQSPLLDRVPSRMPSLRALMPPVPFAASAVLVYAGLWKIARRVEIASVLTAALPLGMIAAPHCYVYDVVVAIPIFAGTLSRSMASTILAAVALSPVPYLLMSADNPGRLGALLIVAAVLVCTWAQVRNAGEAVSPRSCESTAGSVMV